MNSRCRPHAHAAVVGKRAASARKVPLRMTGWMPVRRAAAGGVDDRKSRAPSMSWSTDRNRLGVQ